LCWPDDCYSLSIKCECARVYHFGARAKIYLGDGEWMDDFDDPYWFSAGRNLIKAQLQDYVNRITQFIFL